MHRNILKISQITTPRVVALACAFMACFVFADQSVYKCGQEITNQPQDPKLCQKLEIDAPTQIEGTRVQNSAPGQAVSGVSAPNPPRVLSMPTNAQASQQRNVQARTILEDEWQKLSAKYAEMVRTFNQGQPALSVGETAQHAQYKHRVEEMKTNLQRLERDMQALQRELSRHPLATAQK